MTPTDPSTPWDAASEYPEGDYTEIQLKSPDSALRNGAFERIDPLIRFGMTQDTPDIIAMFDLHATEIDQESTYESSPDSGTPYLNAGDMLFSNGPSKLLRMQIMSGIFLRANINSLFAVFQVENASAPGPLSVTDWYYQSHLHFLLFYVMSMQPEDRQQDYLQLTLHRQVGTYILEQACRWLSL